MRPSSVRRRTPDSRSTVTSPCTALTSRSSRRAVSRIETGPAPVSVFNTSHRLAVRTSHSSSGLAKLMRLERSGRPTFQARALACRASLSGRTSRTTVFTIPPRDVSFEVVEQLLRRSKLVAGLGRSDVSVPAFPALVVVTKNAFAGYDVSQTVLVTMPGSRNLLFESPDYDLHESVHCQDHSVVEQRDGFHEGASINGRQVLSITPTV
jgi:hypothetical protein